MPQEFEELSQEFAGLVKNNLDPRKYFTKKKYAAYFEEYCKIQEPLFQKIFSTYEALEATEEKESFLTQLGRAIAKQAGQDVDDCKGLKKENRKGELNLFMVTSIFPCILKLGGDYGSLLCEQIITAWKEIFPGTELGYSSYEKLTSSFRSFWGFLTGR